MKKVDLLGQRFGQLVVVEKLQSTRSGSTMWSCLCDCGNYTQSTTRLLNRAGRYVTRSCGCVRRRRGAEHRDWQGIGEISGNWWHAHVSREFAQTSRSKVEISIDKEFAWELFVRQERRCALTGLALTIHNRFPHNTASLDRIDSSKGYLPDNVQWVHKDVNMMKRTYDQDYFIRLCKLVAGGVCPVK